MSNWKNKEKVLKAIYMEDYIPDVMGKIDPSLLADRDVIQYAVCIDGCSLEYASDELKNDKEIVQIFLSFSSHYRGYCMQERI